MTYNIHPIFVHVPIAFLVVYSVIKMLPLKRWLPSVAWRDVERVLLVVGVLGAFASLSTGEMAEDTAKNLDENLVDAHAAFATAATWMYGLLLAGEVLLLATPRIATVIRSQKIVGAIDMLKQLLTHRTISMVLAILGLIAISVTGLLGGVLVYRTTADPFADIVLKLLGI